MALNTGQRPQSLTNWELSGVTRALELHVPTDAILQGVWWPGDTQDKRNYRLTMWSTDAHAPRCRTWIAERLGQVFRLQARPATPDEIDELLDALSELGVLDSDGAEPIAEAEYDCRNRSYQLCFTALEDMMEGLPYKRWVFRRHRDGRPLSVGYLCETRRGDAYKTLPGGAILRGNPWSD
jgi:hypothetical protein